MDDDDDATCHISCSMLQKEFVNHKMVHQLSCWSHINSSTICSLLYICCEFVFCDVSQILSVFIDSFYLFILSCNYWIIYIHRG